MNEPNAEQTLRDVLKNAINDFGWNETLIGKAGSYILNGGAEADAQ